MNKWKSEINPNWGIETRARPLFSSFSLTTYEVKKSFFRTHSRPILFLVHVSVVTKRFVERRQEKKTGDDHWSQCGCNSFSLLRSSILIVGYILLFHLVIKIRRNRKQIIDRPVDVELVGRHVSTIFSLVGRIFVRCCETFFYLAVPFVKNFFCDQVKKKGSRWNKRKESNGGIVPF